MSSMRTTRSAFSGRTIEGVLLVVPSEPVSLAGVELLHCASFGCSFSSGRVGMVDRMEHADLQCGLARPYTAENETVSS